MTARRKRKNGVAAVVAGMAATGTERGKAGARGAIARLSLDEAWREVRVKAAARLAPIGARIRWEVADD